MQIIKKRHKKNYINIIISTLFLISFSYIIIAADNFQTDYIRNDVIAANFSIKDYKANGYIGLDNIVTFDDLGDSLTYIVQSGDTLSGIANKFGTTVDNIKKINNMPSSRIKPGQKLQIAQEEGILYELASDIKLADFSKKYGLDIEKLKTLNYISENEFLLEKGDEIFLPISIDTAKKLGFIKEDPKPINKPSTPSTITPAPVTSKTSTGKSVTNKWYYKPNITNGFYRGHCTRYVAIKKFPYITETKQKKLWNGNAKYWYENAKNAGYKVGNTPAHGSIVVIKIGGKNYYSAGHVGIVIDIDRKKKKLYIEDMNAYGRFVVTRRRIPMDSKIIGYIYM